VASRKQSIEGYVRALSGVLGRPFRVEYRGRKPGLVVPTDVGETVVFPELSERDFDVWLDGVLEGAHIVSLINR